MGCARMGCPCPLSIQSQPEALGSTGVKVHTDFTFAVILTWQAASSSNLKAEGLFGQLLAAFDQNLELWSGRLAMIGLVGISAVETVKGDAFF